MAEPPFCYNGSAPGDQSRGPGGVSNVEHNMYQPVEGGIYLVTIANSWNYVGQLMYQSMNPNAVQLASAPVPGIGIVAGRVVAFHPEKQAVSILVMRVYPESTPACDSDTGQRPV